MDPGKAWIGKIFLISEKGGWDRSRKSMNWQDFPDIRKGSEEGGWIWEKHQFVEHCYLKIMGLHNVVAAPRPATQSNGFQHQTDSVWRNTPQKGPICIPHTNWFCAIKMFNRSILRCVPDAVFLRKNVWNPSSASEKYLEKLVARRKTSTSNFQ